MLRLLRAIKRENEALLAMSAGLGAFVAAQRRPKGLKRCVTRQRALFDFSNQPNKKTVIITGASSGP